MKFKLSIKKNKNRAIAETTSRYDVLLNGKKVGELYYNMRGYTGCYLPTPDGKKLDCGEQSITQWRKDMAQLNREAKTTETIILPVMKKEKPYVSKHVWSDVF